MTQIEATFRVATPMFCGGAAPESNAELRLSSFKGVLRFWWRALAWSRLSGDLERIHKEESDLFGSADGGQSRVLMRLRTKAPRQIVKRKLLSKKGQLLHSGARSSERLGPGACYLGYGVLGSFGNEEARLQRPCLAAPFDFTVDLRCRSETGLASLTDALIALGTLGGMGAKSRKGYGSLVLQSLQIDGVQSWCAPRSRKELRRELPDARYQVQLAQNSAPPSEIPYTALSSFSRYELVPTTGQMNPVELLDWVGRELVSFRSWGFRGKILRGIKSEKNFRDDHDLMKRPARYRDTHPVRVAFGLPHNYGKHRDQQIGPGSKNLDRRASPLFIHIHLCDGKPVAVLSLLPTKFLPKATISVGGNYLVSQCPEDELYRPVHDFLNRMTGRRP